MIGRLPFIVYKSLSWLLKRGGWPLVVAVVGLVGKGVLSSYDDIKKWVEEKWDGGSDKTPKA